MHKCPLNMNRAIKTYAGLQVLDYILITVQKGTFVKLLDLVNPSPSCDVI